MGKQISRHGVNDLDFILSTFRNNVESNIIGNKIFSWSAYDWVDDQNYQLVNAKKGINKKDPPDMSIRNYSKTARDLPWSLQLDPPVTGDPSESWVMPAATGILDKKGVYLGAVVVGIDIGLLENHLEERLNSGLSFVITNPDGGLILKSSSVPDNNWDKAQFDLKSKIIHDNTTKPISSRSLDFPVVVDKIVFKNLSYVQKYPLIILTGYDQKLFDYEVAKIVNPAMVQLLFLLIYCNLWFFFKQNPLGKKRKKR